MSLLQILKTNAPLCACCESALAVTALMDPHLGPVCPDCYAHLVEARRILGVMDYGPCRPLGPDSGKGVLGT